MCDMMSVKCYVCHNDYEADNNNMSGYKNLCYECDETDYDKCLCLSCYNFYDITDNNESGLMNLCYECDNVSDDDDDDDLNDFKITDLNDDILSLISHNVKVIRCDKLYKAHYDNVISELNEINDGLYNSVKDYKLLSDDELNEIYDNKDFIELGNKCVITDLFTCDLKHKDYYYNVKDDDYFNESRLNKSYPVMSLLLFINELKKNDMC
tara:strand:- start:497 stop:1126 length:630 start_codon:yes stop_codon:yes gene_type:complete